jgi:enoyl-CoA hydratase
MDDLLLTRDEAIATLVLNRPAKHNALTLGMWRSLPQILRDLETDAAVRTLVVRGAGDEAFAAGADISEFATVRADAAGAREYSAAVAAAERALATFPCPTIALIHGFCVGGGLEVALACDLRWAGRTARFGITAARLGIVYSLTATRRLARLVGPSHARDLLYSGRLIDSEEAQAIGLVNMVCAPESLDAQTYEYARLLTRQAPLSQRGAKRMLQYLEGDAEMTEADLAAFVTHSYESDDYREGVRAFLEKRPPRFDGR